VEWLDDIIDRPRRGTIHDTARSPRAVIKMTGNVAGGRLRLEPAQVAIPSNFGIMTSSRIRSGRPALGSFRAAAPSKRP